MYPFKKLINYIFLLIFYSLPAAAISVQAEVATFAGGCFWSVQSDLDKVKGVVKTVVGYTGGNVANPSYKQVTGGGTGHYEAIQVTYDPAKISYSELLKAFWQHIDPTNSQGQFCDYGFQYHTAIFYHNEKQKKLALSSKEELIKSRRFTQVATQILPGKTFYPAEEYHQKYYQKNPVQYKLYRYQCGRDQRLNQLWAK